MIRKEGKARWVYTCDLCNVHATYPDHFRAIERHQQHEGSEGHALKLIGRALQPFAEAYARIADAAASMIDALQPVFTTPPNIPRDPALRLDRRKWGGR